MHGSGVLIPCVVQVHAPLTVYAYSLHIICILVELVKYLPYNPAIMPPPLCMLALGKTGEGAYSQDSDI